MQDKSSAKSKKLSLGKLVYLVIFTTAIVTVITLSKYHLASAGSSSAKVAALALDLTSNQFSMNVPINPEMENEYVFAVTNNKDDKQAEISMEYTIEIKTLNNLPLEFELYTYDNDIKGSTNLLKSNGNISDVMILDGNKLDTKKYILAVKWNKDSRSYKYSHTIDYIQIVVKATQVN